MKFPFIALFILQTIIVSYSAVGQQRKDLEFISSFVINNEAFNYRYKLTSNQISSIEFEKVSNTLKKSPKEMEEELESIKKR